KTFILPNLTQILIYIFFLLIILRPARSTLFPYTTLFRSNDSHADCYQYFCVPEYGTANGRLHFHAVHFMRTLPTGSVRIKCTAWKIGRAVQQECRDRCRMPSPA